MSMSRREFLTASLSSLAYFSTVSTVPRWLERSAHAACVNGIPDDRILVLFQMGGGNDGLNTVIPYTDPKYFQTEGNGGLRPNLNISNGLELGDGLNALHPKLSRTKDWYDNGNVAILQNIGYPNPNLSHFTGTDFWEYGISPGSALSPTAGWASRFFDNQCNGAPPDTIEALAMMANGISGLPTTLTGSPNYYPPSVKDFDSYEIKAPVPLPYGDHMRSYIEQLNNLSVPVNSELDFIQRASSLTHASIDDMAIAASVPLINSYPGSSAQSLPINSDSLGPGLEMVSKIIRAQQFKTQIFFVHQTGYDTHADQFDFNGSTPDPANLGSHPVLLDEADASIDAFLKDMDASGDLDRVLLLTFSEFGRRPQENGSLGTDHGTANSLFAFGGQDILGGVYGGQPDLDNLLSGNQGGNLNHAVDFRSVYSIVLRDWLGVDPETIFGATDFSDPAFQIPEGMLDVPFIDTGNYDPDPVWVDKNYAGTETGSYSQPYNTLNEGVTASEAGGTVKLKNGSTSISTSQTVTKNVRIEAE